MEEKDNLGAYYSDPSILGGADGVMSDDGPINPVGLEELEEKIEDLEVEGIYNKDKNPSLKTRTRIDSLQLEYNEVENIIIGYIQTSISNLRRLELHKERLLEQKEEIGQNEPNKAELEAEFDRQIRDTESAIRRFVNPSTEENIRIRREKDELYRLATSKIQKLEALISELEAKNRKLNFQYSEMVYRGITDYKLWNMKKNEIDENAYRIRQIKELIGKYENLKEELRKTEKVIDLSKVDEKEKVVVETQKKDKYITMSHPYDPSKNELWDGKDHDIIPSKLQVFELNGVEYYLMSYWDVTYNCECHTYLTIINGQFVKVPVTDYSAFAEIVMGLDRIDVDITILPSHIGLGEILDVSVLISILGGIEPTIPGTGQKPNGSGDDNGPTGPGDDNGPTGPGDDNGPTGPGDDNGPTGPEDVENGITLEGILNKIKGSEDFTPGQASRYKASKIKIFSKPEKNRWGNMYKILSIPRRIFGIIPKTFMKIKGIFVSQNTKDIFEEMQERVDNLTDEELEVLLNEYKGNIAQQFKSIPLVNDMILGAIKKYIMRKYMVLKNQIADLLIEIEYYGSLARQIDEKVQDMSKDDKDYERLSQIAEEAYARTAISIRKYRDLNVEANNLLSGNGLHSFEEEMKAANTKMNYVGGGFTKIASHDPELSQRLADLAQILKYSKNPKEVVEAYFENKEIYIENTEEKRSIFNLGSKVSVGALDYRPLPEVLYYGKDPLIADLITTILLVSTVMNVVQTIQANMKNNQIIQNHNKDIADNNYVGQQHQLFKEKVQGGKDTIEAGFKDQINRTPGASENLAERSTDTAYGWNLTGSSYKSADALHHAETSQLTTDNINAMADLSHKAQTGVISEAEYINGLEQILQNNHTFANNYFNTYGQSLRTASANNPNFDFTSIINEIDHVVANPTAASDFSKYVAEVFENSHMIPDFNDLGFIQGLVEAPMSTGIAALAAAGAKAAQEDLTTASFSWENDSRFIELLEQLRSGRPFTQEDLELDEEPIIHRSL